MTLMITPEPLTREIFKPFGDVIQIDGAETSVINSGYTTSVNNLIDFQLNGDDAYPQLRFFLGRPRPLELQMLERHPLGSQAFYPLEHKKWLVVVATEPKAEFVKVFLADGDQGINYHSNIWHHPLLVIAPQRFIVIDRGGSGKNCDEAKIQPSVTIAIS